MIVVQRILGILLSGLVLTAGQLAAQEVKAADLPLRVAPQYKNMVPLSFSLQSQCQFGDMNALILDMEPNRSEEVILTIEKLGSGGELSDESRYVLSDKEVMIEAHEAHHFKLEIPHNAADGLYGIFICKVSKGEERRCNNKQPANIQSIINRYALTNQKRRFQIHMLHEEIRRKRDLEGYTDKFYFFKPLALINGKAHYLDELMSDGLYQKYSRHLEDNGLDTQFVQNVQYYDKQLGNLPLQERSERIRITMPVFNKNTCRRG